MGAFFLYHTKSEINTNEVNLVYQKKGFQKQKEFELGSYRLWLYGKKDINLQNYQSENGIAIYACGSLFYKKKGYADSLIALLKDFQKDAIDANELYGNYVLLFYNQHTHILRFFIDPAFMKTVYFDKEKRIISTDFLAILENRKSNVHLNRYAIIENLISGCLISPDTYVNEINKIDRINYDVLKQDFENIDFKSVVPALSSHPSSKKNALQDANDLLNTYFQSVKNISEEYGAHIGLTGGFDSRLLLMNARKHINKLDTNSFWRENSIEYKLAKVLAQKADLHFTSFENDEFELPSMEAWVQKSYSVFDGQIRSQNRWNQEFALPKYMSRIANHHWVGFHGCGGEQYRNAERWRGKYSLRYFILHEWMFKQCENPFLNKKLEEEIYQYIKSKMIRLLGNVPTRITLLDVKRIYNEVWNPANRNTRLNVLNQHQLYFAPFTEYKLAYSAYHYVPYLGYSKDFQIKMMQKTDPELASILTNYGYNILQGEPIHEQIMSVIVACLPRNVLMKLYQKKKNRYKQTNQSPVLKSDTLADLLKEIDLSNILRSDDIAFQLNAFDYVISQIKD